MTGLTWVRRQLAGWLGKRRKLELKSRVNRAKQRLVRSFLSYDGAALQERLRSSGISPGDTVMVHAKFEADNGFRGTPPDLVKALVDLVGEQGNLLMVSIPFDGAASDHLLLNKPFHVKKSISMMGLVTELFRRGQGTLRSLHPTHPVLARGKDAAWLVADHDKCLYPCGPGTPFEKFDRLDGKIVFFDVSFRAITFFHYVEHLLKDRLPFAVYDDRLFSVTAVDERGVSRVIETYTFNKAVLRNAGKLEDEMRRRGQIRTARVGNSRLTVVRSHDVISCFTAMVDARTPPYDV